MLINVDVYFPGLFSRVTIHLVFNRIIGDIKPDLLLIG